MLFGVGSDAGGGLVDAIKGTGNADTSVFEDRVDGGEADTRPAA